MTGEAKPPELAVVQGDRHALERELLWNVALGGDGGIIAVDKYGNIAMPFCTEGMYRGYVKDSGKPVIRIYK